MHIFMCLDDRNGISFNGRRLSSDRVVCQRIMGLAQGNLWIAPKTAKLFSEYSVCIAADFLTRADMRDSCFVEDTEFFASMSKVTTMTIFRWNRHYPSDVKMPDSVLAEWKLVSSIQFPGYSHDIITEERYER